ncbi:hypothetical protein H0N96_01945 [Candidatus Micrarchaeota archaeon]|nr:hypothetical protein [Candidatus Micrarchaeota archaeon]
MPMLPEAIWRRRLESEFQQMAASGEHFEVDEMKMSYVISLRGVGLFKNGGSLDSLQKRESHSIQIDLKREYPYAGGIDVTWLTPIFHPNIRSEDGKVCIQLLNAWSEGTTIASLTKALKQLLEKPNPNDALNKEAADYFAMHPNALNETAVVKKPRVVV